MASRSPQDEPARRRAGQFRVRALMLAVLGAALVFVMLPGGDVMPLVLGVGVVLAFVGLALAVFLVLMALAYLGFLAFDLADAVVALVRRAGRWPDEGGRPGES